MSVTRDAQDLGSSEFLAHLGGLGISLSVVGDKLKLNAPKGVVTPDLQSQIVARKHELIAALVELDVLQRGQLPPVTAVANADSPLAQLSLSQERLWSVQQVVSGSEGALFNMYLAFRLDGDVREQDLLNSLHALVSRHAALRSGVLVDGSVACVDLRPPGDWQPDVVDLANTGDAEAQFDSLKQATIAQPFDLTREMPFRATVVRLPQHSYALILVAHHMAADGWSWGILLRELGALYGAACRDTSANLPELPLSYADFAAWQRRMEAEARYQSQVQAWEASLQGVRTLPLPSHASHADRSQTHSIYAGERVVTDMPQATWNAIQSLARNSGTTPFAVLSAAFAISLRHFCNQNDIVFCTPVACREQRELESIVGYFNNVLPLRMHVQDQNVFADLVKVARSALADASTRQDVPFQTIAALPSTQNVNLARMVFSLQDTSGSTLLLDGVACRLLPAYTGLANVDLAITVESGGQSVNIVAEYRLNTLTRELADTLVQGFVALLNAATSQPNATVAGLIDAAHLTTHTQAFTHTITPPSNDTERELKGIWEDVLGLTPISVTTSFFALGGHSLQAIRLMARIESAMNISLPQTALFEAPTIRALAQFIRHRPTAKWQWLVPVQPTGEKPPLVLVHHGAGGIFGYAKIGQHLHPRQPLFGLQEPGWRKGEERPDSIESMARMYITELRVLQPRGPYYLGGFCFGAIVAYEMAQQLTASGESVGLLALIDAFSPVRPALLTENALGRHTSRMRNMNASQRLRYVAERALHRAEWEVTRTKELVRHRTWDAWYHLSRVVQQEVPGQVMGVQFMKWNGKLQGAYVAKPYPGRAILVRSQHPDPLRDFGWSHLIRDGVVVCDMPTEDHLGMLEAPNVQLLAQYLQTYLDAAAISSIDARVR